MPYISNLISEDQVLINNYVAYYENDDFGVQYIDVSNIILSGNDSLNYSSSNILVLSGFINKKEINVSFTGTNKNYDGLTNAYNIVVTISGNYDPLTVDTYIANYRSSNIGTSLIDLSNVVFVGEITNNYVVLPILPQLGTIFKAPLFIKFIGGSKSFDNTTIPGASLTFTISGIVNNEIINVSAYSAKFNSPNVGLQRIDISNIYVTGTTLNNYNPIIQTYIYANIYGRITKIFLTFPILHG